MLKVIFAVWLFFLTDISKCFIYNKVDVSKNLALNNGNFVNLWKVKLTFSFEVRTEIVNDPYSILPRKLLTKRVSSVAKLV